MRTVDWESTRTISHTISFMYSTTYDLPTLHFNTLAKMLAGGRLTSPILLPRRRLHQTLHRILLHAPKWLRISKMDDRALGSSLHPLLLPSHRRLLTDMPLPSSG